MSRIVLSERDLLRQLARDSRSLQSTLRSLARVRKPGASKQPPVRFFVSFCRKCGDLVMAGKSPEEAISCGGCKCDRKVGGEGDYVAFPVVRVSAEAK